MRSERRAADANEQHALERFSIFSRDLSGVNIGSECLDMFARLFDLSANFWSGRQRGVPEPIMSNHSLLGGISDCSGLQRSHRCKRFIDLRLHFFEEIIREFHPADVERETKIAVVQKMLLKTLPE